MPGFEVFTSPLLCHPGQEGSYFPGSCMVISHSVIAKPPPIHDELKKFCQLLNVVCCFVTCNCYQICIVSVYRSSCTDNQAGLCELQHIVTELSLVCQYVVAAGDLNIDLCSSSFIATAL